MRFLELLFAAVGATQASSPPRIEDIKTPLQRVAFGSCNDQSFEQPLWKIIAKHEPEAWIWMGDNIYGDLRELDDPVRLQFPRKMFIEATEETLLRRYARLKGNKDYSDFVEKTPVIAIWDDHDFGINDGHKGYTYRKESQKVFLDFFNEPEDSPRRQQEGIYTSYTVGSGDKTVKFILVDNRYHRDDYLVHDGDFLGKEQWAWLERELTESTAAFNVIVSGIQILPADRFFNAESWSRFPHQRERLLQLILSSKAKGVVLLSGDVHFSEINQVVCSGGQNVLTEMTSSGMTHSWMEFHAPEIKFFPALLFTFANMILPWEFRPHFDDKYAFLNWGMLEFDWDAKPSPVAHVVVRGRDDQVKLQFNVSSTPIFSETPAEDAISCKPPREIDWVARRFWQGVLIGTIVLTLLSFMFNIVVLLWLVWFFLSKLFHLVAGPANPSSSKVKKTN